MSLVISKLFSYHCPTSEHLAIQNPTVRDELRIVEWERFGSAFCRRVPEQKPLETVQQVDEAVTFFDTAVVSAVDVSSRMKLEFTPDYQRIPADVT